MHEDALSILTRIAHESTLRYAMQLIDHYVLCHSQTTQRNRGKSPVYCNLLCKLTFKGDLRLPCVCGFGYFRSSRNLSDVSLSKSAVSENIFELWQRDRGTPVYV